MNVEVAIMTCPREPVYVTRLLDQMFARQDMTSITVRAVVDGADPTYLGPWAWQARVQVETLPEPTAEPIGAPGRIMRTFRRCLERKDPQSHLIVIQDDTEVTNNWLTKTRTGYEKARQRWDDSEFFLALWSVVPMGADDEVVLMPVDYFFGNVGLFIPSIIVPHLQGFLRDPALATWPDDMALKRFAVERSLRVLNLNPSVVQHVGSKSTREGAAGSVITSPTYQE